MKYDCGFTRDNKWFRYRAAAIIVEEGCVLFAGNELDNYYYSIGGGVHMGETAEDAVRREVLEETGVPYEVDRLAVIHENFFDESEGSLKGKDCHELSFYFLMKPRGTRALHSDSHTQGVKESMHWIPIEDLGKYKAYPTFLADFLSKVHNGIEHIVTDERKDKATQTEELHIELQDTEWPYEKTTHDRHIARAIVFDTEGYFYFVHVNRDDAFGKASCIETPGGGVEAGEDLKTAITRELNEELGADVEVLCKIGVVSDYYNVIGRHNLSNYFLCKVNSFGERHLTEDEQKVFHLQTMRLTYDQALAEYEKNLAYPFGRLVAHREVPILKRAKELIEKL